MYQNTSNLPSSGHTIMANTKRAWKLQEFAAHGADVNCVGLGHKSGRVMVTGGEDRKVNLWSVGKPHCIMSLTGHTTTIEAVRFGHAEEMVVAGSQSGALKVWDLEQAKILRTLTGHKAGIKSLDFHPYGEYTASGSMDCNVKLWDIRRKGCIYTYKGHASCVNCLRFSPDGRWIASAGEDGVVKLWDLTAGKLLTDLKLHKGSVNIVEFHPHELLLASGSSDRTVKFWDLESFQLVSSTEGDSTPIRSIAFHPDGVCLYTGCKDTLKVYGWEPMRCYDTVAVGWGDVGDMNVANTQLIGASYYKTNVSTFVVDLEKLLPARGSGGNANSNRRESSSLTNSRKNFITERPPTQSSRQNSEPKKSDEPAEKNDDLEETSAADIQNPAEHRELFQVNSRQAAAEPLPSRPRSGDRRESAPQNHRPARPIERSPPPHKRSPRQDPGGINAEDFLPKQAARPSGNIDEEGVLDAIGKGHDPMSTVMSGRSRNLQIVRAMWTSGNTKVLMESGPVYRAASPAEGIAVQQIRVLRGGGRTGGETGHAEPGFSHQIQHISAPWYWGGHLTRRENEEVFAVLQQSDGDSQPGGETTGRHRQTGQPVQGNVVSAQHSGLEVTVTHCAMWPTSAAISPHTFLHRPSAADVGWVICGVPVSSPLSSATSTGHLLSLCELSPDLSQCIDTSCMSADFCHLVRSIARTKLQHCDSGCFACVC